MIIRRKQQIARQTSAESAKNEETGKYPVLPWAFPDKKLSRQETGLPTVE